MKQSQIMKDARALITNEGNWIKGKYAADKDGRGVRPLSEDAVCFCMLGAIRKVIGCHTETEAKRKAKDLWEGLRMNLPEYCQSNYDEPVIHRLNDIGGHAAVLQHMDNVAAYLEGKGL